jgi:hypothetical protein
MINCQPRSGRLHDTRGHSRAASQGYNRCVPPLGHQWQQLQQKRHQFGMSSSPTTCTVQMRRGPHGVAADGPAICSHDHRNPKVLNQSGVCMSALSDDMHNRRGHSWHTLYRQQLSWQNDQHHASITEQQRAGARRSPLPCVSKLEYTAHTSCFMRARLALQWYLFGRTKPYTACRRRRNGKADCTKPRHQRLPSCIFAQPFPTPPSSWTLLSPWHGRRMR